MVYSQVVQPAPAYRSLPVQPILPPILTTYGPPPLFAPAPSQRPCTDQRDVKLLNAVIARFIWPDAPVQFASHGIPSVNKLFRLQSRC